ncbi:MAG: hypothetical protein ACEQSQ_12070 [Candidatus Paceibacteria bacterium]
MFKILDDVCKPTKGSKYSAAIDLYAREDVVIGAGETVKVPLGVCIDSDKLQDLAMSEANIYFNYTTQEIEDIKYQFLESHYLQLEPRSSLRAKGLIAGTGIIDLDYKDEIMIILHNPFNLVGFIIDIDEGIHLPNKFPCYEIKKGDKVAQIMLKEHKTYLMGVDTEEKRTGGFGSTDK